MNGKVPLAQFAWSIHMMPSSSCVPLITRAADHTCVVPTTVILTALNTSKKLMQRKKWLLMFQQSLHPAFHCPQTHSLQASSHVPWNLLALSAVVRLKDGLWLNLLVSISTGSGEPACMMAAPLLAHIRNFASM